jgi:hypothetical protein
LNTLLLMLPINICKHVSRCSGVSVIGPSVTDKMQRCCPKSLLSSTVMVRKWNIYIVNFGILYHNYRRWEEQPKIVITVVARLFMYFMCLMEIGDFSVKFCFQALKIIIWTQIICRFTIHSILFLILFFHVYIAFSFKYIFLDALQWFCYQQITWYIFWSIKFA